MAYYFLFPEKDTTIYSHPRRTDLNTGKVETLCLDTEEGNDDDVYYPSRILIKFKDSEIKSLFQSDLESIPSFKANLKLYTTDYNQNLPVSQTLELYPLVSSWENGTQRYNDHPAYGGVISNGTSWLYKDNGIDKNSWPAFSPGTTTSSFGSINNLLEGIGGTWYYGDGFESTQSISIVHDYDLNFEVTSQIQKISSSLFQLASYPDGITNNGFIIKRENDITLDKRGTDKNLGSLKYFSTDTHTIFSPTLIIKWDDSSYVTGSNDILDNGKIQLNFSNLKNEYKQSEKPLLRLNTRKQYPDRTFTTSSNYLNVNYLTSASYYSIEDYTSKETIIPFDTEYTKLSADSEGMYFKLNMQGLQPERYYRLLIRHDNNDGISIYDDNYYFKVTR